jgi:hypothetical protein
MVYTLGSGPLIARDTSELVGIVSWGYECADAVYPGVYTRVETYDEWIDDVVCNDLSPDDCVNGKVNTSFGEATPSPRATDAPSTKHPTPTPTQVPTNRPTLVPTEGETSSPSNEPAELIGEVESTISPSFNLIIMTPSTDDTPKKCKDRNVFIVSNNIIHSCTWVKERKEERCAAYKRYCPETCQVPGCKN